MRPRLRDGRRGRIDARHGAAEFRELLGEEAAAAADIERAFALRIDAAFVDEHVAQVVEAHGRERAERGEEPPLVPPRRGVVDGVIDGHGYPPPPAPRRAGEG